MSENGRLSTGITGLDALLGGGLMRNRLYLVHGDTGTGKTTLALEFLLEGGRKGEKSLYVALSETPAELSEVAGSHGWSLEGIHVFEVQADEHVKPEEEYTAFHPSEVELGATIETLQAEVDRIKPVRVAIDSLTEMRLLARDPLRYRRQILALKHFFINRGCTLLLLDDPATKLGEHQFQSLAHGVILLERFPPEYGRERRRLQIIKLRGTDFEGGYHDFSIRRGGLVVYPQLGARHPVREFPREVVSSGVAELDALLDGGPMRGTANLIMGAAGTGKSTLCIQYVVTAARRGENAAIFSFDERLDTIFERAAGLGMDLRPHVDSGRVSILQVDPASLTPGEFIWHIRQAVEQNQARIVVIDSINGYLNAMPGERFLQIQMREILTYLARQGVLAIVVVAQHGLVGMMADAPVDLSYLADTVLVLRYFEHAGRVRKAISVLKKREGRHEDSIREIRMSPSGVIVGEPLVQFEGVLSGTPRYLGTEAPLLKTYNTTS